MFNLLLMAFLPFLLPFNDGFKKPLYEPEQNVRAANTGTLEKLIVANGDVTMDLNLNRLNGVETNGTNPEIEAVRFRVKNDSFFNIIVFNGELRGALPSSMEVIPQNAETLPSALAKTTKQFVVESLPTGGHYDLVVRDGESGMILFNVDGYEIGYHPQEKMLEIYGGRLLISPEFAAKAGRAGDAGAIVGTLDITAKMRAIEVSQVVDGEPQKTVLPAGTGADPEAGTVPGPDVVVGDVNGLAQFGGITGTRVGLALGTDSCNFGTVDLNWFAMPSNDHPVIPQNLYRMSGGTDNAERFEQIGQSRVKHGFTALTQNICNLGCNGVGGSRLGSGCSDPYSASLNAGSLSSRAWVNPFTGFFPRGDSATPPGFSNNVNNRILTEINDLNTNLNQGATYYAEGQYVTPHEYAWCQTNPTQCNMYNNVSYRRYNVTGTGSPFSFSPVGPTQRQKPAIMAWTGATVTEFRPAPGQDGIGMIGYKVSNPSPGVWHYEYAVYNMNLDRAIESFSVPVSDSVTLTNIGFSAPPQHPGAPGDGTVNNLGYSSAAWAQTRTSTEMIWRTESFAQNPNANAIRWGTMYNFRFRSDRPPQSVNATIGFLKTGAPITVPVQAPAASAAAVRSRADFDGDGRTDPSVYRNGVWHLGRSTAGYGVFSWGAATDTFVGGDFDGDGKADLATFRPTATSSLPDFYVLNSATGTVYTPDWGTTGDAPVIGDYTGDGKADVGVWRSTNNTFYILPTGGGAPLIRTTQAGTPVVMDWDGDGKADFANYSNGVWTINPSGGGATRAIVWGTAGDILVPADYDNDNKDDVAVFRPSNGTWYIYTAANTVIIRVWGTSGDIPVPGDYNGDGSDDIAVFRDGTWFANTATGVQIVNFGLTSDKPVPRNYLPQPQ